MAKSESASSSAPTTPLRIVGKTVIDLIVHARWTARGFLSTREIWMVLRPRRCSINLAINTRKENTSPVHKVKNEHFDMN